MGNSGSLANAYYNVKNTKNKNTQKQSNSNPNHSGPTTRSKKKKANIADMYVVTNDGIDVFFNGQFMIKGRHLMYEDEIVQCAWIVHIDDGKYYNYVHYFGQNQVDGDDLYSLNLNDLINYTNNEMDIKHCRKLLSHIDALKAIKSKKMTRSDKAVNCNKIQSTSTAPIHIKAQQYTLLHDDISTNKICAFFIKWITNTTSTSYTITICIRKHWICKKIFKNTKEKIV